jgi:hypothetical protein
MLSCLHNVHGSISLYSVSSIYCIMWEDKDTAEAHYQDLLRIKARLEKESDVNEYRMKTINDMINIADSERNSEKREKVEFYR